jgi:hypothetical protein
VSGQCDAATASFPGTSRMLIMHVEVAAFLYLAVAGVYAILRATGTEPLDMLKKEDRQ